MIDVSTFLTCILGHVKEERRTVELNGRCGAMKEARHVVRPADGVRMRVAPAEAQMKKAAKLALAAF
jgi:hypothetical protein